ncbi:serine hydrolase domain-containing protein [Sphingomonas lycopersici]|uniref:Beta-lactamase family protein n=1 Tax=Sphingomonas lycopersici TaxID=2951807 RepID=A0AA41Z722_9SPHN|nr:beta-lactamase family protein [Sphingomonas lycopersici]
MDRRYFIGGVLGAAALAGKRGAARELPPVPALGRLLESGQTSAMTVLHRGEPIFTYGDLSQVSYLASARKSLVSMLYGPSVKSGAIRLDRTLAAIGVDDLGGLLPIECTATVRNLLMARSGIYHPAANAGDASALAPPRGSVKPGRRFLYNNWDFNALGAIFEIETGRKIYDAFDADIARPIGLQDWRADLQQTRNDTGKSLYPAHHFGLSTRDMARLGQLMLDRGRWRGRPVIPASWVALTTALHTPAARVGRESPFMPQLGYGYLWWVFDAAAVRDRALHGAYTASGAYGQFITIVPRLQLVVAHKTAVPPPRNVSPDSYFGQILPAALKLARDAAAG